MNKDLLVQNIKKYCAAADVTATVACTNAGVGKDLVSRIKKGIMPSIDKVTILAAYLGVTTSDLVGDAMIHIAPMALSPPPSALDEVAGQLNEAGQRELLRYAKYLTTNDEYIKSPTDKLG